MEDLEFCAASTGALSVAVLTWFFCLAPAWKRWCRLREEERHRREAKEARRRAAHERLREERERQRATELARRRAEFERQQAEQAARRKKEFEEQVQLLLARAMSMGLSDEWDTVDRVRDEIWSLLKPLDETVDPGRGLRQALNHLDEVLKDLRGPLPPPVKTSVVFRDITGAPGVPPTEY